MENCLAAAALNAVDRHSLQRSARLGREVLERAQRRAVDWRSLELPKGSRGLFPRERPSQERWLAAGPQLLPGEREEISSTLSASFKTIAEFMDYTSSQCGKYYSSVPEERETTHVYRYHRGKSDLHLCPDIGTDQRKDTSLDFGNTYQTPEACTPEASHSGETTSKDLYIEVYPGTYSVTVGANNFTKKTHVVAVDSGQSVDLVFPV